MPLDYSHQHSSSDIMQAESVHTPIAASGLISVVTASLTDAQIKSLPTTPVELFPAPGDGKLIVPFVAVARMEWHADYGNINATSSISVDLTANVLGALAENTLSGVSALLAGGGPDGTLVFFTIQQLAQTISTPVAPTNHFHSGKADSGFYDSDIVNKPMRILAENVGDGDFTGGDAANVLRITIFYAVIEVIG